MKSNSCKSSRRKKVCRSYKYFDIDLFKKALQEKLVTWKMMRTVRSVQVLEFF